MTGTRCSVAELGPVHGESWRLTGGQTKAGAAFAEGDVLLPKIANVKILSGPKDDAKPVATLGRGEELVVIGGVENGFVNVQGANGSGGSKPSW